MWIYILAPLTGGALAAAFDFFHEYAMLKMKQGYGIEKYQQKYAIQVNKQLEEIDLVHQVIVNNSTKPSSSHATPGKRS